MSLIFCCPHCQHDVRVPTELLGGKCKCPLCARTFRLPASVAPTPGATEGSRRDPRRLQDQIISGVTAVVLHSALLLMCLMVTCDAPRGEGAGVEVGVGAELPGEQLTNTDEGTLQAMAEAPAQAANEQLTNNPVEIEPPATSALAESGLEFKPTVGGLAGGVEGLNFSTKGEAGGGGGTLEFMRGGQYKVGKRFCIIADRSGSMSGSPMEYVKSEVLRAISDSKGAQFFVIFFDDQADIMPGGKWLRGSTGASQVAPWVKKITARGSTYPSTAFRYAFENLDPRPDVILFLTDGLIPQGVPDEVAALNRSGKKKVVINTISFMDKSGEHLLRRIAEQSGGTYRHVDR